MTDILIDPLALVFLLVLLGCVLSWFGVRGGKVAALSVGLWLMVTAALLLAAAPALVNRALGWHEARDATLECDRENDGVRGTLVVLSGGVASRARTAEDYQELYQPGFARLIGAYQWLRDAPPTPHPETESGIADADGRLIIVAGGGKRQTVPEAEVMRAFLLQLGVPDQQLVTESDSANTQGSAIAVAELLRQRGLPLRVELMTSALHMPRAARAFRTAFAAEAATGNTKAAEDAKTSVSLCTRKVDRQAVPDVPWHYLLPQTSALVKFDRLLHEWVGELYALLR